MCDNEELIEPQEQEEQVPESATEASPAPAKQDWKKSLLKDMKDILVILGIFMLVYVLFFRAVVVVGDSMNDTLVDGDRLLLISNLIYAEPKQGDIIVAAKDSFRNGEPIVKRIIATEGQTVDIDFKTGTVYVDGVALTEPYISTPTVENEGASFPLTVPEGCIFVMGDNRMNSLDSRSNQIGLIDEREIIGKVIFLLIPGSDDDHKFELGRIGLVK